LFDGVNDLLIVTGTYDFGDGRSTGPGLTTFAAMGWTSGVVAYEWNGPNGTTKTKGDASIVITNGSGTLGSNNHTLYPTAFQATVTDGMGRENGIEGRCNAIGQALRSNNNPSLITDRVAIGGNVNTGEFMNGGDAEWLIFNYMMSNAQRLEVETYLAIKYGTTLGTTGLPSNYLSSAGTIIWAGDNTYQNNVIGIGRDGTSTLLQKQSHNYDDTVRIYKGTLALTNQLNAATFAVDRSFVLVGANTGNMCSTAATNAEMPAACGLYSRLDREWKVTRTNMAENFNMDFTLNSCANPASVNVADLRLLVDDDGNFGNGGTTCYQNGDGSGIVFTYANPVITVSNFNTTHIPNNATRYITIASVAAGTPLPIVLMDFRAQCQEGQVSLSWKTAPQSQEDHFDLERSEDGTRFVSIARITGQNSNSQIQKYVAADQLAPRQALYYRLHGVAEDGGMTTTEIVHLDATDCGQAQAFGLYPNPASGNTVQLAYVMEEEAQVTLQIINSLGQVCGQSELHLEEGSHVATLSTEQLAPGYYLVQILSNKWETKPLRFVKQ
jgi:Secretion system C-terminal sorting domain